MKLSRFFGTVFLLLVSIFFAFLYFKSTNILPVLADGTHHVWLVDFVWKNGYFPKTDVTGTQPFHFNVPRSISNNSPMLYQPLYYLVAGYITFLTRNPTFTVDLLNIVSAVGTNLIAFFLIKRLFGRPSAAVSLLLISSSSVWFWLIGQRLIEPVIIFIVFLLTHFLLKFFDSNQDKHGFAIAAISSVLLSIKFSNLFIVGLIMLFLSVLLFTRKKYSTILVSSIIFFVLYLPTILFSYYVNKSPIVIKTGVAKVDNFFVDAWWNEPLADWEVALGNTARQKISGSKIYDQYYDSLNPPQKTFSHTGIQGIINEFSLLPVAPSSESFQTKAKGYGIVDFSWIILLLAIPGLLSVKKNKNAAFLLSFVFTTVLSSLLFWYKQPQFRYYIYALFMSVFMYAAAFSAIDKICTKFFKQILIVVLIGISYIQFEGIKSEFLFLSKLNYSAMYRLLPDSNGGLDTSIKFAKSLKQTSDQSKPVFTSMKEIAFYSGKKFSWDYRLFLVDSQEELLGYLDHYDFDYIVLPFYSGKTPTAYWRYYDGIPSDSTFYEVLQDERYFRMVESNSTFTAYERI